MNLTTTPQLPLVRVRLALVVLSLGLVCAGMFLISFPSAAQDTLGEPAKSNKLPVDKDFGAVPLSFEVNQGQTSQRVRFMARGRGYGVFLTPQETVIRLKGDHDSANGVEEQQGRLRSDEFVRMRLVGANKPSRIEGLDQLPGIANYFIGNDPKAWHTNVPTFARVKYQQVYAGIDLIYHGNQHQLEYDFVVGPRVSPEKIRLSFAGSRQTIDTDGSLIIKTGLSEIRQSPPIAYQWVNGQRSEVQASYRLKGKSIGFEVGAYNKDLPLIIDPVFLYSTFLGGSGGENGQAIAVDAQGNAYLTGSTSSSDFPLASPLQPTADANGDAFVTKLNSNGTGLVYSTFIGGNGTTNGNGIAVDAQGNAYVVGVTGSGSFPTTPGSIQTSKDGVVDGFIAKIAPAGSSLVYCTFLGGNFSDTALGVAVDSAGDAYVVGQTDSSQSLVFPPLFFSRHGNSISKSSDSAAQWSPIADGLTASVTTALAQDPVTPANLYAGTNRGVYRSTDSGAHWQAVGTSPAPLNGNTIVVDPSNPNIVYVGSNNGLFKSTNAGITFTGINSGLTAFLIQTLAIDPSTPTTLYAGTNFGIFKTVNGGDSWTAVNNGFGITPRVNKIVIDPSNPTTVYVGTSNRGLFKTTNGGSLWTQINTGALANTNPNITALVINPTSPATLYAGVPLGSSANVLFKTTDGGASWTISDTGLTFNTADGPFKASPNALAIDQTTPSTVYAATINGGVYKSIDSGATWAQANTGLNNVNATMIAVDRVNSTIVYAGHNVGTDGFVVKLNPTATDVLDSAMIGGDDSDAAVGIAVDAAGVAYIVGNTASPNFPAVNALDSTLSGFSDAFVMKVDFPNIVYATLLGGNGGEIGSGIAVRNGSAYVVGTTASSDFPLANPIKSTLAQFDGDGFVTKINPTGTALDFSTYFGGSAADQALAVAVDASGIYVTGSTSSADFPTANAPQTTIGGSGDAFVSKLNSSGSSLIYSTYLGGVSNEFGKAIAVDSAGNAYVCGTTSSADFPTVHPFQNTLKSTDAFVTKIGDSMDLSLAMTDTPDPVALGSNLTYNITVSNVGALPATNITFTDPLPAGATFVSANSGQGSCMGTSTVTCNLGTLNGGAQTTVTIVIKPPASTNISNTASVTATETDPTPANNTTTQNTQVNFTDLSVSATTAFGLVAPGAKVNYLLKVTNLSGSAAPVTLTDNLPAETTFVSCATTIGACGGSANARTVTMPSLAVGQSASVTIVATLNPSVAEGAIVTNTVTVDSTTPDTNPANNSASVGVTATATPLRKKDNGKIAFNFEQIFTVKSDASELPIQISTGNDGLYLFPRWSPDGSRLAYGLFNQSQFGSAFIKVANADGSGAVTVANNAIDSSTFTWSPDGSRIAYVGNDNSVYIAQTDGSGSVKLPNAPTGIRDLDWSPDGSRFVFVKDGEVFTVDVDGGNLVKLASVTPNSGIDYSNPLWSPDMTKIMLVEKSLFGNVLTVSVMNSDGTHLRKLINSQSFGQSWSPDGKKISFFKGVDVHVIGFDGSNELTLATSTSLSQFRSTSWQPIPTSTPLVPSSSDPQVFTISGSVSVNVLNFGGFIKLSGTRGATTILDDDGHFQFVNLPKGGTYTVTPVNVFGTFNPPSRTIDNLQQDVSGVDFVFTQQSHTVHGVVTDPSGNPLPNRTVSLFRFSSRIDTLTDQQGKYAFANVFPGDGYFVLSNCDPVRTTLPAFFGDYTADLVCDPSGSLRSISGRVLDAQGGPATLKGFTVTLDGARKAVVKTDSDGHFEFNNLPTGMAYTVTPSTAEGFSFTTPQLVVNNLTFDQSIDFIATTVQPVVGFSSLTKTVGEADHSVQLTVNRTGDTSKAGSVDYETADNTASERTDYDASFGTVHFAPGETSKTLKVLITDDVLVEGDRSFTVTLTNGSGVSVSFNDKTTTVIIVDNDVTEQPTNPISESRAFVRQQYADFLNREPDQSGFDFWTNEIESCGADAQCREVKRINVSAAFFLSIEFQDTGFLVYRMHDVAFGTGQKLKLKTFLHDTLEIGHDIVVGQPGWEQQLAASKAAFANNFGLTQQFLAAYPLSMSNTQFVDMLNHNAGDVLGATERNALVSSLNAKTVTRGEAVRTIAENVAYRNAQSNKAFVLMQYFGYLRRAPNDAPDGNFDGWTFWLNKLNQFNGNFIQAEMVKAFISSTEYVRRFGK